MFYAKVKATKQLPLLRRLFPEYKGRTVILCDKETAPISDYWDEGHRAYPKTFVVTTGQYAPVHWDHNFTMQTQANPFYLRTGTLTLVPGIGLCEHVFSGTRQYLRVTLHPSEDKGPWID